MSMKKYVFPKKKMLPTSGLDSCVSRIFIYMYKRACHLIVIEKIIQNMY
jgi:hypothetical protein